MIPPSFPASFPRSLGGVEVDNPVWLAPLAGITVPALRRFHRRLGAGLAHTEMVSALGLAYRGKKTRELLTVLEGEGPLAAQLFGPDAPSLAEGARLTLAVHPFQALEINMACPMPKVARKGAGAALLERPDEAVRAVRSCAALGVPLWVKVRLLPGGAAAATARFCGALLEAGAAFLLVHGRTPGQRYEGTADRDAVCALARLYPGLLGASGDLFTPEDARAYLEGGCASVLVARGLLKDPLLVPRILEELGFPLPLGGEGRRNPREALLELGDDLFLREGERTALLMAKRMVAGWFRGGHGAAERRHRAVLTRDWASLRKQIQEWPDREELDRPPRIEG